MGIYPDTPYWSVATIKALPGNHRVSITVGLSSAKPIPEHQSTTLRLEITAYKGNRYHGELFRRIVPFKKSWPAHKPVNQSLLPTGSVGG